MSFLIRAIMVLECFLSGNQENPMNRGKHCGLFQMVESHSHKVEVTGSSPVAATTGVVEKAYFVNHWVAGSNPAPEKSG